MEENNIEKDIAELEKAVKIICDCLSENKIELSVGVTAMCEIISNTYVMKKIPYEQYKKSMLEQIKHQKLFFDMNEQINNRKFKPLEENGS